MAYPAGYKYTKDHEWVRIESGNIAHVGITDYAQGELGDVVFVELPQVGSRVAQMKSFGTIDAVKTVSDLFAPVSGEVVAVNTNLKDDPALVNRSPVNCIPSPESPANRMTTRSFSSTCLVIAWPGGAREASF